MQKKKVLLVNMPFGGYSVPYPSMALSLLKPLVERAGFDCDISYLNVAFRAHVGQSSIYRASDEEIDYASIVEEWVFGEELFGREWGKSERGSLDGVCARLSTNQPDKKLLREYLTELRLKASSFIPEVLESIEWEKYSVIGFTSVVSQQTASLALAHHIKKRWPDKIVALGGANCDAERGIALLRLFSFVDWVFSGEADLSFPQALTRWFSGHPLEGIQGVSYRQDVKIIDQGSGELADLERLPYPDYSDYLEALRKWWPSDLPKVNLLLEASRGCWWGDKSRCIFCAYDHKRSHFRHKPAQQVIAEIKMVKDRYGINKIMFTDAIMEMEFFRTLFPYLSDIAGPLELRIMSKANLKREQIAVLGNGGVIEFQPGIETLDTEMLDYMHKGVRLLQCIQLAKWAAEYGISCHWNVLYGFPGENPQAYSRMAQLIPKIMHLEPPARLVHLSLQRFSPLIENSQRWGQTNIRAMKIYESIFPFDQPELDALAEFFESDFENKPMIEDYIQPVKEKIDDWQHLWKREGVRPLLVYEKTGTDTLHVYDTRPGYPERNIDLTGEAALAYLACDTKCHFESVAREIRGITGNNYRGDAALYSELDELVSRELMLQENGWYLSLANNLEVMKKHNKFILVQLLAGTL